MFTSRKTHLKFIAIFGLLYIFVLYIFSSSAKDERLVQQMQQENELVYILQQQVEYYKQKSEGLSKKYAFKVKTNVRTFPATSVYCSGDSRESRTCKFKNLYYEPKQKKFLFLNGEKSTQHNSEHSESDFIDLTSVSEHNVFFWDYIDVDEKYFDNTTTVSHVPKLTFLLSRFHAGNIMHTLHDDLIGLYFMLKMYGSSEPSSDLDKRTVPFSDDFNLLFHDNYVGGPYADIFKIITRNPVQYKATSLDDDQGIIHFNEIVVGNSKKANWYQYGFGKPQGPIANKTVSGFDVREVADYLMRRMQLPTWEPSIVKDFLSGSRMPEKNIAILSRKGDRLILNEQELADNLSREYKLKVVFVRMEEQSFEQQVAILKNTVIAVGMHGSLLIMAMFMPPSSVLIEMYPYRVPAENYIPYKHMCSLSGINITYRSWTNTNEKNNIAHPENPPHQGGIHQLDPKEQEAILNAEAVPEHQCCSNPFWLFRIYQDTKVETSEVVDLINDALAESKEYIDSIAYKAEILAAPIKDPKCKPEGGRLTLTWDAPWNAVKPVKYGVWVHQTFKEEFTGTNNINITCESGKTYEFWVRPYVQYGDSLFESEYSPKVTCECPK